MSLETITVSATIDAPLSKVWDAYTLPDHITRWNFASDDWCCPSATNDLRVGGRYVARMEARDGSFGFDFEATYTNVQPREGFSYVLEDGRAVVVSFQAIGGRTQVTVVFDPETTNPVSVQRDGWQAILDNFKAYVEAG